MKRRMLFDCIFAAVVILMAMLYYAVINGYI